MLHHCALLVFVFIPPPPHYSAEHHGAAFYKVTGSGLIDGVLF